MKGLPFNSEEGPCLLLINHYYFWYCIYQNEFFGRRDIGSPPKHCPFVLRTETEGWSEPNRCFISHIHYECPLSCEEEERVKVFKKWA